MNAPIDFYFDFSSPYSYIAAEGIDALAAQHGRRVNWRAILLGVLFQPAELKPPVAHPIKRDYVLRDFERSARFAGVPLKNPAKFPIPTHNAARVFWWLHDGGAGAAQASAWARHCMQAYFADGEDLSDPGVLRRLADAAGAGADAAEAAWNDAIWKQRLKAENEAAVAAGVFGAPFVIADGEPFWGHDRFAQLQRWLGAGPF